jgi:hypothetical protein
MNRVLRVLCGLLAALGLYACDYFALRELKPGQSTGYDVRDRMGQPSFEWRNADGSVTWEFARTPEGKANYLVTVGPDNILREIVQVLTEENFARVRKGMVRDEVRHLLGKPGRITRFDLKRQEVWEWKIHNPFPNVDAFINVHFDDSGRVVETSRHEEQKG